LVDVEVYLRVSMNTVPHVVMSLLALGAILSGCSCGEYRPQEGKSVKLLSASPTGTFNNATANSPQVKCDAKRNCTMTFKDGADPNINWSVDFTLDSTEQVTDHPWREL
jgi:hypothetical protein